MSRETDKLLMGIFRIKLILLGFLATCLFAGCGYIKGAAGSGSSVIDDDEEVPTNSNNKILISKGDTSIPGLGVAKLYAYDTVTGEQSFLMDAGTGFKVGLMSPATEQKPFEYGLELNGKAYFYWNDSVNENALWETDFTQAGTKMIFNVASLQNNFLMASDEHVVFGDKSDPSMVCPMCPRNHSVRLFNTMTNLATTLITLPIPGMTLHRAIPGLTSFADAFNFWVQENGPGTDMTLQRSNEDGSLVVYVGDYTIDETYQAKAGTKIFSWVDDGVSGSEPSFLDAATGVVTQLLDINVGAGGSVPGPIVVISPSILYFVVNNNRLYSSDGTPGGTFQLHNLGLNTITTVSEMFLVNGRLVLFACDGGATHGCELWTTAGDALTTYPISFIEPGAIDADIVDFAPWSNEKMIVFVRNSGGQIDPWVTDGTAVGTFRLAAMLSDEGATAEFHVKNGKFFFTTHDIVTMENFLWTTDGTALGTTKLFSLGRDP